MEHDTDELATLIRMLQDFGVAEYECEKDPQGPSRVRLKFHPVVEEKVVELPTKPVFTEAKKDRTSPYVQILGELPKWPKAS